MFAKAYLSSFSLIWSLFFIVYNEISVIAESSVAIATVSTKVASKASSPISTSSLSSSYPILLPEEYKEDDKIVTSQVFGFHSPFSRNLLEKVIFREKSVVKSSGEAAQKLLESHHFPSLLHVENVAQISEGARESDLAVIYVHYNELENSENSILARLQSALRSISREEEKVNLAKVGEYEELENVEVEDPNKSEKKSIIVSFAYKTSLKIPSEVYEKVLLKMLNDAWALSTEKAFAQTKTRRELSKEVNIHIISFPFDENKSNGGIENSISDVKKEQINAILIDAERRAKSIKDVISKAPKGVVKASRGKTSWKSADKKGIDVALEASDRAIEWTRETINASIQRLQKPGNWLDHIPY